MNDKAEQFKKLVEEQQERIRGVCRYFFRNEADQQDLFQEILINTWNGLDAFRGDSKPGTWMYRIAVNTALGLAGKERKRMQFSVSLEPPALQTFTEETEPSGEEEKQRQLEGLENQINQLSVIDKILVSLMLQELSYREIADIVGITEPNVRVKIHRIKSELKQSLKIESHENNEK
jgi:RNA polymerase sigma-70 factor (ECF subfamily)